MTWAWGGGIILSDGRKKAYVQYTLPFKETVGLCAEPAKAAQEAPLITSSDRKTGEKLAEVSKGEIPNNPAEMELKSLLNQVRILTEPLRSKDQIVQDCQELKKIIELKDVNEKAKITGLLDHLCAGARWDINSLKNEIKKLQDIRSQTQETTPKPLKKPLQNKTLYSILDKSKIRSNRPQNEEFFGKKFYRRMEFNNYKNPLDNKLHALQWIEDFDKKISFLFKKSNDSRYVLHKYLSIAKKAILVIKPSNIQQEPYSDNKSRAVKD